MKNELEKNIGFMKSAFQLAEKGRGKTNPNPLVGAVIVKNNKIIGSGYHKAVGKDHAEIMAIKSAGAKAKNATMYVSLEPCCHTGRTGPCTDAIIKSKIKKVVYASKDPDKRVAGKGAKILREAGLEVSNGILKKEAELLNDKYFGFHKNNRPFVIVKAAQTLDGRIATESGDSKWISGETALKYAHRLRADVDAVVVGSNTFKSDNPSLTVRNVKGKNPYRIVLTTSSKINSKSNLISNNNDDKTIIATSSKNIKKIKVAKNQKTPIIWEIKADKNNLLDLNDFLDKANQFGIKSILVEGGATLITSFVKQGLVDKLILITAPKIIGSGIDTIGNLETGLLNDALKFSHSHFEMLGKDSLFIGYPQREA